MVKNIQPREMNVLHFNTELEHNEENQASTLDVNHHPRNPAIAYLVTKCQKKFWSHIKEENPSKSSV